MPILHRQFFFAFAALEGDLSHSCFFADTWTVTPVLGVTPVSPCESARHRVPF